MRNLDLSVLKTSIAAPIAMSFDFLKSPDLPVIVKTVIVTIVGVPTLLFFALKIRTFIKTTGAHLIEAFLFKLSRLFNQSLARHFSLKHYCRLRLKDDTRELSVPSSTDIKLPIDDVFVRLLLSQHGNTGGEFNHRDILDAGNRIRVIGDPGSGKSSLVKRLFRDACRLALKSPKQARLPIIIELKNLPEPTKKGKGKNSKSAMTEKEIGDWFVEEVKSRVSGYQSYQMGECFDAYVVHTGILLLLDGLDEVPSTRYEKVQSAILAGGKRLAELGAKNIVLLTMRSQFHQQVKDAYRDSFGPALFLKPFSPSDIYEFLTRWPFNAGRETHITRIYGELTDRPTLRDMCSNPLVLSMYVAEDQAAGHVVAPESRTEFYRKVTEELIIKRRIRQSGPTPAFGSLREQREKILGRIAFAHMLDFSQPANSLSLGDALQIIAEVMDFKAQAGDKDAADKLREETTKIFNEISKETGLISEERPGQTFRFIHLTFCEFLAAFECVQGRSDGWTRLFDAHRKSASKHSSPEGQARLLEVIPFACGLSLREARKAAITDVATLHNDSLLARSLLETKQYAHAEWPGFVERQRLHLAGTPEAEWDERWLRDLHLFNVVLRDAKECAVHMSGVKTDIDLDQFFEELASNQKASLAKLLSAYAAQDPVAAFRLAEVSNIDLPTDFPEIIVEHCDKAPFLSMALDAAGRDRQSGMKWSPPLTESALRSQLVADEIEKVSLAPSLTNLVESLPRQRRWDRAGLVNRTAYSDLLTITANTESHSPRLFCVEIIKNAPSPGSVGLISASVSRCAFWLFIISIIGMYAWAFSDLDQASWKLPVLCIFLIAMIFTLGAAGQSRLSYRSLLYKSGGFDSTSTENRSIIATLIRYGSIFPVSRLLEFGANIFRPNEMRRALDQMNSERERGSSVANRAEY